MKKKITRKYLESLLTQKDWGKKGSDEREVTLILICSGIIGAYPEKIEKILGNPKGILRRTTELAKKNKIWRKDGTIDAEWKDKKSGTIALACDVAVCMGWLKRSSRR
jgi:hypothetical protein